MLLLPLPADQQGSEFRLLLEDGGTSPVFLLSLDQELQLLREWIPIAADALMSFFIPSRSDSPTQSGGFSKGYRSVDVSEDGHLPVATGSKRSALGHGKESLLGNTSTLRAFYALHEYLRWATEEDLPLGDTNRGTRGALSSESGAGAAITAPDRAYALETLQEITHGYLSRAITWTKPDSQGGVQDILGGENLFRDSHFLMAAALLGGMKHLVPEDEQAEYTECVESILKRAIEIAHIRASGTLRQYKGGVALEGDHIHDFITTYAVRGIDALAGTPEGREKKLSDLLKKPPPPPAVGAPRGKRVEPTREDRRSLSTLLYDRARKYVPRVVGFHAAGMSSQFDAVELAFSLALLNRFSPVDDFELTRCAVNCIARSQLEDGAWPQGRRISFSDESHPDLPSYEVSLSLTHLLIRQVAQDDLRLCLPILQSLRRAFTHVRANYSIHDDHKGWGNDHARLPKFLESWTTAVVLTFLVHYCDGLLELRQRLKLRDYRGWQPEPRRVEAGRSNATSADIAWPDMWPAFRYLVDFDQKPLDKYWDPAPAPTTSFVQAVKSQIGAQVQRDWIHRPPSACSALILWGDPGTGKTSLIVRLAQTLSWPLVRLSPPDFLRHGGLDGFEAAAEDIFEDLMSFRRVVVLFDECEDFFKTRLSSQHLESRTIGAFITAGMLPRLQHLRRQRWIIFAVATNSALDDLDEAVRRPGRFDRSIRINHPDIAGIDCWFGKHVSELEPRLSPSLDPTLIESIQEVLKNYEGTRTVRNHPSVSFAILEELVRKLSADSRVKKLAELQDKHYLLNQLESLIHDSYPPELTDEASEREKRAAAEDAELATVTAGNGVAPSGAAAPAPVPNTPSDTTDRRPRSLPS